MLRFARPLILALSVLAVGAVAGCGGGQSSATDDTPEASGPHIRVTFSGEPGTPLEASGVHVTGNVPTTVELTAIGGGRVIAQQVDADGVAGQAVEFPTFDPAPGAPAAAVLVSSPDAEDPLDPGDRDFAFGAEVRLVEESESDATDSTDNGNNVVQKGLYLDPSQYKLQVDHGYPSCRVAGSDGDLTVRSQVKPTPGVWYRVACERTADGVSITVSELGSEDDEVLDRQVAEGATGTVAAGEKPTYLSVGAKTDARGLIPDSSTDQFNGLIAAVFVDIRGSEQPDQR